MTLVLTALAVCALVIAAAITATVAYVCFVVCKDLSQ